MRIVKMIIVMVLMACVMPTFGEVSGVGSVVELVRHEKEGKLEIKVEGRNVLTYQYGKGYAIPHYHPLLSPSGKSLLVQHPDPFPHHRSLWIVDRVKLVGGKDVDFYHCWKNYNKAKDAGSGYRHYIRHIKFTEQKVSGGDAVVGSYLQWVVDGKVRVLDEHRKLKVISLGDGEYLLDLSWELKASYGDVKFMSDWVHYAWPYLRMHTQFNGEHGGVITDDKGRVGQKATNAKYADWVDYSNTVKGVTEGLAVFVYPDGKKRKWLTRAYGTFGPRRPDALSGTRFVLKKGKSLKGRVGILVHRGDVKSGRVKERFKKYCEGGK